MDDLPINATKKMSLNGFEEIEEIGIGSTSITKKYKELKTGQFYCVKKYNHDVFDKDYFLRECSILSELAEINIPSLLSLYGYRDEEDEKYIITKYYPKTLRKCIDSTEPMSPSNIYIIILGIAEGMKYLHSLKKIHRDLKPENILIDVNDEGDLKPVICDYGHSRKYNKNMTKNIGTSIYRSPEIAYPGYNEKVDVYSFSIIFYELYSIEPPFLGEITDDDLGFFNKVVNENHRPKLEKLQLNKTIKDFIELCWDRDPNKRPSFKEIVEKLKSNDFRNFLNSDDKKTAAYLAEFGDSLTPKDPVLAKQLADLGNVNDEIGYADLIRTSNKNEALIYYEKAAQKDDAYANLQCALLQVDINHNNDESRLKASQYLKKAIDLGNYEALKIFTKDNYGQLSKDELEKSYKSCAESGNPEAMFKYAEILYQKNDKENALKFFMEAANKRNIPSISRAARMLDEGDGVNEDKLKAKIYFDIGKKLNDSYTMLFNALSILKNNYSNINNVEIVENFREAANLGNSNAQIFYAIILKQGYFNVDINKNLSIDNLRKARNSISDDDAKLAFDFAKKIMNGEIKCFKPKDEEVFLECAAKKGIVDAMIFYADFLQNAKNETEAQKWLKRAVDSGSKIAREKYCNLRGIFHKLFYNLEKNRINYNIDLLEHVITVLAVSLTNENKPKILDDMKKKNVNKIDDVLKEINDAYKFIYDKDPNETLIRKVLEKNLNDSDFQ